MAATRGAATNWRSEPGLPCPKPDGQVRDIIEVLLGTAMRTGEVLALRPCDLDDHPSGMVAAATAFRDILAGARLADSGISLRWYRRTGATVIARGWEATRRQPPSVTPSGRFALSGPITPDRTSVASRSVRAHLPDWASRQPLSRGHEGRRR